MTILTPRTDTRRTWIGILLFLPLAALILGTLACLPMPVGDPEKAALDKDLIGAWEPAKEEASTTTALVLIRALDAHTYYVQYLVRDEKKDADGVKEELTHLNYRGWLATLGGETFICLEALDNTDYLPGADPDQRDSKPYYWVAQIKKEKDKITTRAINADSAFLKDIKTQAELEAAIAKNIKSDDLYDKTQTFRKLGKEDLESIAAWRKKFHLGLGGK
jgi:hypothetical protein